MTDFIADVRQRSRLDRRGFAAFGREIKKRAKTAEPIDEFQVADHPKVKTSRGRERKVGKYSKHPRRAPGRRCIGLFFCARH